MRVCLKCGYIDNPIWKHVPFSYYIDGCPWREFKKIYPELATKITSPKTLVEDEHYVYRVTVDKISGKFRWVQRKAKIDYTWGGDFERTPDTLGAMNCIVTKRGIQRYRKSRRKNRIKIEHSRYEDFLPIWNKLNPNQKKLLAEVTNQK